MIAVITADIINSTQNPSWKSVIQPSLEAQGTSPKDWNLYRGDSLQIRIPQAHKALDVALMLKSSVMQIADLDIRIAIGIGTETEKTDIVTQNAGSAYVNSGRLLETLAQNLEIKTDWEQKNEGLNASLGLVNTLCEQWTPTMASYVNAKLLHPEKNQEQLAQILDTTQSNVSRVLMRASYNPIEKYLIYFRDFVHSMI